MHLIKIIKDREYTDDLTEYSRGLQVRGEVFIGVDDFVWRRVLLALRLPERTQFLSHVLPLLVRVLVARRHLLDRVNVNVNVRAWVRGVEHLSVGQDKATRGILHGKNQKSTEHICQI